MSIAVRCACGKKLAAPYNLAGKRVKCPHCQQPLEIPQRASAIHPSSATSIPVVCGCGKRVAIPQRLATRTVKCPSCGNPLKATAAAPPREKAESEFVSAGFASLLDEVGAIVAKSKQTCPQCKADMNAEAILCVACGYHVDRGRQLKTRRMGRRT